jgi:hypothetical protein
MSLDMLLAIPWGSVSALLESLKGTGKTPCLLCATLGKSSLRMSLDMLLAIPWGPVSALFESLNGTGKTLCLLCATLGPGVALFKNFHFDSL